MTQYFENWRGNTPGTLPNGWTRRFTTSGTYEIVENLGQPSGLELKIGGGSNTGKLLTLDAVDSDPGRADAEVVVLIHRQVSASQELGAVIRAAGATQATGSYYRAAWTSGSVLRISKRVNGAWTLLGSAGKIITVGNSAWIRFRVEGTSLKAKIWDYGAIEPASWNIETTDSDLSDPGWIGTFSYDGVSDARFRAFGIGTGGDTAPTGYHSHSVELLNSPTGGASPLNAGPFPIYEGKNPDGSTASRYLLVSIPYEDGASKRQITGVTYAGQPLTLVGEKRSTTGVAARESLTVYGLANPPVGSGDVIVSYTGTSNVDIAVAASQYNFPFNPEIAEVLTAESQAQRVPAEVEMTLDHNEIGWFSSVRNDGNYFGSGYGVQPPLQELVRGAVQSGSTTGFIYALGQGDQVGPNALKMWWQDAGADDDSVIVAAKFREGGAPPDPGMDGGFSSVTQFGGELSNPALAAGSWGDASQAVGGLSTVGLARAAWGDATRFDGDLSSVSLAVAEWRDGSRIDGSLSSVALASGGWREASGFSGSLSGGGELAAAWSDGTKFGGELSTPINASAGWREASSFSGVLSVGEEISGSWRERSQFGGALSTPVNARGGWADASGFVGRLTTPILAQGGWRDETKLTGNLTGGLVGAECALQLASALHPDPINLRSAMSSEANTCASMSNTLDLKVTLCC